MVRSPSGLASQEVPEEAARLPGDDELLLLRHLLPGMAHELNNPLSVVLGQAKLLAGAAAGTPFADRAGKISLAAERCARIVRNYAMLAGRRKSERCKLGWNDVVKETAELLGYTLRVDSVAVSLDLAADVPLIPGEPTELRRLVALLILQAHEALRQAPPPRTLTLATRFDPAAQRVTLSVTDSRTADADGPGDALVESGPAPEGRGTPAGRTPGFWREVVRRHGGTIEVERGAEHGATLRLVLPAGGPGTAAEAAPPCEPEVEPQRSVLIVDDDPELAEILREALVPDGHRVEIAADGAAALDRLGRGPCDLVVTDLRMPGMDGQELYRRAAERHPGLAGRFVFVTGDVLDTRSMEFLERNKLPRLLKPFGPAELREAVRRALHRA